MAPRRESTGPTTVLETSDPGLLAVAKSLLGAAGIPLFANGEALSIAWGGGPVKLQVPVSRAAEAQALLAELKQPKRSRVLKFPPPSS
jgi:Putative prokaryotic signal transducing protein